MSAPGTGPSDRTRLCAEQRTWSLTAATSRVHDLVIIGGGVTGAGCALDAAARGLSVVLVEAGDIAIGTSSRSGKTFHGGLRYLEQLNFSLVAAAIAERDLMVRTLCPHLARPEPFLLPLTRHRQRPYIGAGVAVYDLMGLRRRAVPHHRHHGVAGTLRLAPCLEADGLVGAISYSDVRVDDARHTLAVARTAAGLGARILTRARVTAVESEHGRISGVTVEDRLTGLQHRIRARAVVNATGVWAADLEQLSGSHTFDITASKGVHLVLRGSALDSHTGLLARADDSVIVARRWWDHWIVGTTDTPLTGDRRTPVATAEDVDYLLAQLNRYLRSPVTLDDVVGVYAGVRPLLSPTAGSGDAATSALSRDHTVITGPTGLVTVVGGKYTTYRRMAADAVNAAVEVTGLPHVPASSTSSLPLIGAAGWRELVGRVPELAQQHGVSESTIERLLSRYGSSFPAVLDEQPVGIDRQEWSGYLTAELIHAVTHEGAMTLSDVLTRRTHLAIETEDGAVADAPAIAALLAPYCGWDAATTAEQVTDYLSEVAADRVALTR